MALRNSSGDSVEISMGTMKVGKEDDKAMRPMFPRLHALDTDKGGTRAPPRNKMALYEQLSIPLQRSSSTTLSPHKPGTLFPSTSSSQGGSHERTVFSPFCLPHSTPSPSAKKPYSLLSHGKHMKTMEFERKSTGYVDYSSFNAHDFLSGRSSFKMKHDDDDDFRVPTFVQSTIAPHSKDASLVEANKPAPFGVSRVQKSATLNSTFQVPSFDKPMHEANASGSILKANEEIHGEQECREADVCKEHGLDFPTDSEACEILIDPLENSLAVVDGGAENNMRCMEKTCHDSAGIGKESSHNSSVEGLRSLSDMGVLESRSASKIRGGSCSGSPLGNCHGSYDEKTNGSGELKDADRSCDVSEASIVDSISGFEISPDDVVGVIGPKQFWKARRAIVNQQRAFAIQVFELHRLIKVQKVFAASPHLLLDDSHIIKIQAKVADSFQKPTQGAYPLVEKAADPPHQTQEREPNKELDQLRYLPQISDRPNPWLFQPPANQWLMPVMSTSSRLVYKPYSGSTAGCGSCGPLSLPSVAGDFNTAYGVPASREIQGSTASSGCDTPRGEGRDVLALFPSASAEEGACEPSQSSSRGVIKVVPHNRRSATESAARIFRSIQKERQLQDL